MTDVVDAMKVVAIVTGTAAHTLRIADCGALTTLAVDYSSQKNRLFGVQVFTLGEPNRDGSVDDIERSLSLGISRDVDVLASKSGDRIIFEQPDGDPNGEDVRLIGDQIR